MTKSVYIFIMSLFILAPLHSSEGNGPTHAVIIGNVRIVPVDNDVKVSFTVSIDKKAVSSDYALTLTPVLANGTNRVELRPLVVQGRRARIVAERKGIMAKNQSSSFAPMYSSNGKEVLYLAEAKYQPWMEGAQLVIQKSKEGCCNVDNLPSELLADGISVMPIPLVTETATPLPPVDDRSTGDKLAGIHGFLYNADKLNDKPERHNSAIIYYAVSQSNAIDTQFMENKVTLDDLTSAINTISASNDCRIDRIEIVGYASPEGPLAQNIQLAFKRALTLKKALIERTPVKDAAFVLTNGSENWEGLREMVAASDMPEKEKVLNIIDHTPVWDAKTQVGRLGLLMRLNQGEPYRYMAKNFFPKLRNATCVKVYYRNL